MATSELPKWMEVDEKKLNITPRDRLFALLENMNLTKEEVLHLLYFAERDLSDDC